MREEKSHKCASVEWTKRTVHIRAYDIDGENKVPSFELTA